MVYLRLEGNTTWKHQDAYCKMVIAGCLNQSKRILQKFDEVIYRSSPELLIEPTHTVRAVAKGGGPGGSLRILEGGKGIGPVSRQYTFLHDHGKSIFFLPIVCRP